jgi:eukaryotic-like serine/threonine-protein kinase
VQYRSNEGKHNEETYCEAEEGSHGELLGTEISRLATADSKWVYYLESMLTVMRVPLEGGQPEVVEGSKVPSAIELLGGISFSRDGKRLVIDAPIYDSAKRTEARLVIINLNAPAGSVPHLLDPNPHINSPLLAGGAKFSLDGKAVVYAIEDKGAGNLWMQPLDGSPGYQITNFSSERIGDFRWSPDGKTFAVTREQETSDVVLLQQSSQ